MGYTLYGNGSTTRQGQNWRDLAQYLSEIRSEYNANIAVMTPYEQLRGARKLAEETARLQPEIVAGALAEWNIALTSYQAARAQVDVELAKEIVRWKPDRLREEIELAKTFVDGALTDQEPEKALERLYSEAKASKDDYKVRAVAEALRGVAHRNPGDLETRMKINRVAKIAEADLKQLRNTPGLQAAHEKAAEAVGEINRAQNAIYSAGSALGQLSQNGAYVINRDLDRALRRVEIGIDGNPQVLPEK